jgi:hypothetical protein
MFKLKSILNFMFVMVLIISNQSCSTLGGIVIAAPPDTGGKK